LSGTTPIIVKNSSVFEFDSSIATGKFGEVTAAASTNGNLVTFGGQNGGSGATVGGNAVLQGGTGGLANAAALIRSGGGSLVQVQDNEAFATIGSATSDIAPTIFGSINTQAGSSRKFRAVATTVGSTAVNAFTVSLPNNKSAVIHFTYILRDVTTPGVQNNAAEGAYVGAMNISGTTSQFGGLVTYTGGIMRGSQAAVNNITLGTTTAGASITVTAQLPIATDTYDWTFDVDPTFN
jgi:hypothetical protein